MFVTRFVKVVFLDNIFRCLESCYWHLLEERFCFDKNIALYEEPVKADEKNNNMFDNMAFYDSVAVIAGRAVVTIDPLPEKKNQPEVVLQPPKRLRWFEDASVGESEKETTPNGIISIINEMKTSDHSATDTSTDGNDDTQEESLIQKERLSPKEEKITIKKSVSFHHIPEKQSEEEELSESRSATSLCPEPDIELRRKSLRERRMSKSLYLKIDYPKEVPVIRQNSVPKFFVETPEENQTDSTLLRGSTPVLKSPMIGISDVNFDLYSVVQIEKSKSQSQIKDPVPIHRESSRLSQIKGKIKLKKSKSTISSSNIPHTNYI